VPLTDTHCHLDSERFDTDRQSVIQRALDAGVRRILVPALDLVTSQRIVKLAEGNAHVFAGVGFHPTEAAGVHKADSVEIRRLAASPKVVAVGEIGLDYYWAADDAARAHQRSVLQGQLDLAREVSRPVILHMREAHDAEGGPCAEDLMAMLEAWIAGLRASNHALAQRPGVLHSFSGVFDTAMRAIGLGFCVGVTGPVTYKKAASRRQLIAGLPIESLLIETDAPFLSPEPYRGQRNEPAFVVRIADKIAEIHSRTLPEIAALTNHNAARLFAWGETV
jgi:TatD DNase family protein